MRRRILFAAFVLILAVMPAYANEEPPEESEIISEESRSESDIAEVEEISEDSIEAIPDAEEFEEEISEKLKEEDESLSGEWSFEESPENEIPIEDIETTHVITENNINESWDKVVEYINNFNDSYVDISKFGVSADDAEDFACYISSSENRDDFCLIDDGNIIIAIAFKSTEKDEEASEVADIAVDSKVEIEEAKSLDEAENSTSFDDEDLEAAEDVREPEKSAPQPKEGMYIFSMILVVIAKLLKMII